MPGLSLFGCQLRSLPLALGPGPVSASHSRSPLSLCVLKIYKLPRWEGVKHPHPQPRKLAWNLFYWDANTPVQKDPMLLQQESGFSVPFYPSRLVKMSKPLTLDAHVPMEKVS